MDDWKLPGVHEGQLLLGSPKPWRRGDLSRPVRELDVSIDFGRERGERALDRRPALQEHGRSMRHAGHAAAGEEAAGRGSEAEERTHPSQQLQLPDVP